MSFAYVLDPYVLIFKRYQPSGGAFGTDEDGGAAVSRWKVAAIAEKSGGASLFKANVSADAWDGTRCGSLSMTGGSKWDVSAPYSGNL